ncbi:hypothetical protein ACFQZT_23125 [Paenibacillus sp. GCM10027628]|uniref:hypothetical protein n=1 Tax=Paenibacillus sp. GCM10027628 TaxID=3273413 RepID=UPI003627D793
MLVGICVFLISVALACFEIPRIWKQGWRKEVWIYCTLMALGNVMATWKGIAKEIPNPADWITVIVAPLTKLLVQIGLLKL